MSFQFWRVAAHMDDKDIWFLRYNTEDGYLKDTLMSIHLVEKNSPAIKFLLEVRDTCRNEKWAFDEYKANKIQASQSSESIREYKVKKTEASFLEKIHQKYGSRS